MEIEKKIEVKQEKIRKLEERIQKDRQKIQDHKKDIEQLQKEHILGLVNELKIPFGEIEERLKQNKL